MKNMKNRKGEERNKGEKKQKQDKGGRQKAEGQRTNCRTFKHPKCKIQSPEPVFFPENEACKHVAGIHVEKRKLSEHSAIFHFSPFS